jgi:hypothetical protein
MATPPTQELPTILPRFAIAAIFIAAILRRKFATHSEFRWQGEYFRAFVGSRQAPATD